MSDIFTDIMLDLDLEVSEMVENADQIVKLSKTRVQDLLDDYGDDKPQFPVLRVESGVSGNGNNWSDAIFRDIAEQINNEEKPGYWGHIPPDQRGYVFPDPETLWLGAVQKTENGKSVLYVKGYNLPGSRARRHRSVAKMTSWAGKASGKIVNGVRQIEKFVLESIDWARPGSQGMNAKVIAFATEMEGSENQVEWGKVTLADIERENPSLFTLMREKVEADYAQTVSEMKDKAEKADEAESIFSQLRKLLKIDAAKDIVEAVAEAVTKVEDISTGELKNRVAELLSAKVKDPRAKSSLMRLFPVTEMIGRSDEEIGTAIDEFITNDEDAQAIVTEMSSGPAPLSQDGKQRSGSKVGGSGMVREISTKL